MTILSLIGIQKWFLNKEPLKVDTFRGDRLDKKFRSIGLVALVESNEEIETIMSFYNELIVNDEDVACLLFTNKKDLKNDFLMKKSDANWIGKPLGSQVESFLSKEYDQIWFATYAFNIPIQYIIRNSNCHLKLGLFAKETWDYCHLFVDLTERSISSIISELKKVMLKINKNG